MALYVYSAKNYKTKLKVTIQATGKLGFTTQTADVLGLSPNTFIKIACDDSQNEDLYMIICKGEDEDGFKVSLISGFYSLQTTILFNELGIDYKNNTVIFDLIRDSRLDQEANGTVYKMSKRIKNRNKKELIMK
ncbi:MAG: hypothetical protein J6Y51_00255 [Bacteroidaceae bacterium]|nr:hypothetical protein [Bacteroidaceae bacterium]